MKRFWQQAAVMPQAPGFALALDGRLLKTPAGHDYVCPTQALAAALAAEWQGAPQQFDPRQFSLTPLVATALDITGPQREANIIRLMDYAAGDLLCFRADLPPALKAMQEAEWQPYLDWAGKRYKARLATSSGLQVPPQEPAALNALRQAVAKLDDFHLTALEQAASLTGSLVLALALVDDKRPAAAILAAAELESRFQMQHWGEDEEARQRHAAIGADLAALEQFVGLLA